MSQAVSSLIQVQLLQLGQGTQMHVTEVIIFLSMLTYCSWLEHELNKEHACHSLSKGLQ